MANQSEISESTRVRYRKVPVLVLGVARSVRKLYFRKIIVLEANDDVLMKRLEDGDNFNDALETIPKRIKTYRYKGVNIISYKMSSVYVGCFCLQ